MKLRYGSPEEAGMAPERIRHIRELAERWVAEGITPALVVLAARRGVIVLHEAFGRLTPEPNSPPVVRDTIFPLASITKPITATAAMILVEDGLLGLNRPVQDYLPEFRGEGKENVMVHHLLTHTSGLDETDLLVHVARKQGLDVPPSLASMVLAGVQEWLCLRYDAPLSQPPGTQMIYSTTNYELLGEIVRRLSGGILEDFTRERIFEPLGMQDTHYVVPDMLDHRTVIHPPGPVDYMNPRAVRKEPFASAGVYSTGSDMAIFGQMFLNRGRYAGARVISPPTVAAMTHNQIPGIGARYGNQIFPEAS